VIENKKHEQLPVACAIRAKAQFRLRRELSRTIRPSLTPALRLGLVGTHHTGALALTMPDLQSVGQQTCSDYLLQSPRAQSFTSVVSFFRRFNRPRLNRNI